MHDVSLRDEIVMGYRGKKKKENWSLLSHSINDCSILSMKRDIPIKISKIRGNKKGKKLLYLSGWKFKSTVRDEMNLYEISRITDFYAGWITFSSTLTWKDIIRIANWSGCKTEVDSRYFTGKFFKINHGYTHVITNLRKSIYVY